jgi:outer membrane protein
MAPAHADDGPFEVRLRAVYLDMANKSDAIPSLKVPSDAIHVNSKEIADLDLEYFFAPNWSSELLLTNPQNQTVSLLGTNIGTFKHLPPTLTVKYDFLPQSDFQPYVGVGVNLTIISNTNIVVPGVSRLYLNSTSVGPAAQAGFDYKVAPHWYLSGDFKWVKLGSDVKLPGGDKISAVHLDPMLFGVGVGYRF